MLSISLGNISTTIFGSRETGRYEVQKISCLQESGEFNTRIVPYICHFNSGATYPTKSLVETFCLSGSPSNVFTLLYISYKEITKSFVVG